MLPFSVTDGFVEGTNVLEFDVENCLSADDARQRRLRWAFASSWKVLRLSRRTPTRGDVDASRRRLDAKTDGAAVQLPPQLRERNPRKGGCFYELTTYRLPSRLFFSKGTSTMRDRNVFFGVCHPFSCKGTKDESQL